MERWHSQHPPADLIPVERFEMSQVEDVAMSFGDGTIVEGFRNQEGEKFVGPLSRAGKSFGQMRFSRHTRPHSSLTTQSASAAAGRSAHRFCSLSFQFDSRKEVMNLFADSGTPSDFRIPNIT